jgi:hypothetical protein
MKRFLFLFLLTSQAAMSQTPDSVQAPGIPPKSDFRFGVLSEMGYQLAYLSLPNVRSFLQQNQIEAMTRFDPFVHLNVGMRYYRLKLMAQNGFGVDLFARNDQKGSVAQRNSASYSAVALGYDVINGRNNRLYDSACNRTSQPVSFQNVAQYSQPGDIPSLRLTNTYWDISLEFSQREKRKSSVASVLRVGYRRGLQAEAWKWGMFELTGGPSDRISQVYFQAGFYLSSNYTKGAKR